MRICYITETLATGVGRHVVDLAEAMHARGHDVHVVYSPLRCDQSCLERLKAISGVRTFSCSMARAPHPSDMVSAARLGAYLLRHGPFDIVHGHSSKGGALARILAPFTATGCLYTPHAFVTLSPELPPARRRIFKAVEWSLSHLTNRIICVSSDEFRHARALGISLQRLAVVHNGINDEDPATATRAELGVVDDMPLVVFAGRLEYQKGPDLLVRAAAQLAAQGVRMHTVLLGGGSQHGMVERLLKELGVEEHVSLLGHRDAAPWLAIGDVLAMPSRYEAFSYTLLEAAARGLPIVCTDVGGARAVVRDHVNGFITPVDDVDSFAARLRVLVEDAKLRAEMGARAQGIAKQFSVERMSRSIEAIYSGRFGTMVQVEAALAGARRESPDRTAPMSSPGLSGGSR